MSNQSEAYEIEALLFIEPMFVKECIAKHIGVSIAGRLKILRFFFL
jgi:hypothetical protein